MTEIDPQICAGLGRVVISWAKLEGLTAEFLSFLLGADHGAMYVLNQDIASGTQMKWVRTLAADRFSDENTSSQLAVLFGRIDAARAERNAYVHGLWSAGEGASGSVQSVKVGREYLIRSELVTTADLDELFGDIESMVDELFTVLKRLEVL